MNPYNALNINRQSLHAELVDSLRTLIINGDLPPGSKVPENDLCDVFKVSRTPLREALKVLAPEGLVVLEPNRGTWVSQITADDLKKVYPVMSALEALSGELACQHITNDELAEIRRLHDKMRGEYDTRDQLAYFATNQRIHKLILTAARNEILITHHQLIASRFSGARFNASITETRWRQAMAEHEEIMQFLELRDCTRLSTVLKVHLSNKLEAVCDWLTSNSYTASIPKSAISPSVPRLTQD